MLTHEQIWRAIDRLAASFGYSPSGLAKQSGLDSTSFNKSKRIGPDGKPRWPSTESIARILTATGATMSDFVSLVEDVSGNADLHKGLIVPVIGFAQAGAKGYFDEEGYPKGDSWDEIRFPDCATKDENSLYALRITGDSMEPLYRAGDILVVSPHANVHTGDRVILKTTSGEVMAKELVRQTPSRIEVASLNPAHENIKFATQDVAWIARIIWVSQ